MVDEAATISEKTSGEAETVAAAAEEQTSALAEVSASTNQLSTRASRLDRNLERFHTSVDGTEPTPAPGVLEDVVTEPAEQD